MSIARVQVLVLALLAVWLWWPAATPVPVEGFSAMIGIIGKALAQNMLARADAAYPFDTEFFGLSRLGMDLLVALGTRLGMSASAAMTAVHLVSFGALTAGSMVFARQWCAVPGRVSLLALLLVPGIGDSAFFLHENMAAAALLTGALIVIGARQTSVSAIATGLLLAGAMLTRTDAVLLTPAIPLILWLKGGSGTRFWLLLSVATATSAVTYLLVLWHFNVTPLDVLAVVKRSVELWPDRETATRALLEGAHFIGLPGAVLVLIGSFAAVRNGGWGRRLLLVGLPLLFLALYGDKLWQARQYLPLTPFVVTLAALGAKSLWTDLRRPWPRAVALGLLAILWLTPGTYLFSDGPRAFTGRLFSPLAWQHWQAQVRSDRGDIDQALIGLSDGGFVLTDDWNMDRYTHLALIEAGWRPVANPSCGSNVEAFTRSGQTIRHVRLHLPFFASPQEALPALFKRFEVQCLPLHRSAQTVLIGVRRSPAPASGWWFWRLPTYGVASVTALDADGLKALGTSYADTAGARAWTLEQVAQKQSRLVSVTNFLADRP